MLSYTEFLRSLALSLQTSFLGDEKVAQILHRLLSVMSLFGVFQLPGSLLCRKFPSLHKIYMGFTFLVIGILLSLSFNCAFTKLSTSFIDFFPMFLQLSQIGMLSIRVFILNKQRDDFLQLVDLINQFDVFSYPMVFIIKYHRLERLATFTYMGSIFGLVLLFNLSSILTAFNDKNHQYLQTIYGFKYPQNRLPICLWIPSVDTSELHWFIPLFILELYFQWLVFVMSFFALIFPDILIHLVGQHFVLFYKLKSLGKSPLVKVTHKWMSNQPMRTSSKLVRDRQYQIKRTQDILQVKKCIVLHQRLLRFCQLYGSVTRTHNNFQVVVNFCFSCMLAYAMTILSQFDIQNDLHLIFESFIILCVVYTDCFMSEVLERANERIRHGINQSTWYEMCPEAQRMMLMFLRRTQGPHHIRCLGGMVILGNEIFLKYLKTVYSVVRVFDLKK
ncbi:hypothetical protein WDU94_012314 [Cyamophila willieti]